MNQSVINRILSGKSTELERKRLSTYFMEHPEVLETFMTEEDWNDFDYAESRWSDKKTKAYIRRNTYKKLHSEGIYRWQYLCAAACIIALFFGGALFFHSGNVNKTRLVTNTKVLSQENQWVQISNKTSNVKVFELSDGSSVELYPRSDITYSPSRWHDRRDLFLKGEAKFSVSKDSKRVFTVMAGNTATRVLGTVFIVKENEKTKSVTVCLLKGKVVVHRFAQGQVKNLLSTLKPGMVFNNRPVSCHLSVPVQVNFIRKKKDSITSGNAIVFHYSFDKEPLDHLLDTIQSVFSLKIKYDRQLVRDRTYTGVFDSRETSAEEFLRMIGFLNGFKVERLRYSTIRIRQ